jgi:hypothetical protein
VGKPVDRVRIQPYIPKAFGRRLREQCVVSNSTESAYVTMALQQTIDGVSDWTLLLKRLDRIGRALERLQRSVDFLGEAFAAYLLSWFAHTPVVVGDSDRKAAARASAEARYKDLMRFVVRRFTGGHRFIDDLPRESIGDDAELEAIASHAGEVPTGDPVSADGQK